MENPDYFINQVHGKWFAESKGPLGTRTGKYFCRDLQWHDFYACVSVNIPYWVSEAELLEGLMIAEL